MKSAALAILTLVLISTLYMLIDNVVSASKVQVMKGGVCSETICK